MDEFIAIGDVLFGWFPRPSTGVLWLVVIPLLLIVIVSVRRPVDPDEYAAVQAGKRVGNFLITIAAVALLILMLMLTVK